MVITCKYGKGVIGSYFFSDTKIENNESNFGMGGCFTNKIFLT